MTEAPRPARKVPARRSKVAAVTLGTAASAGIVGTLSVAAASADKQPKAPIVLTVPSTTIVYRKVPAPTTVLPAPINITAAKVVNEVHITKERIVYVGSGSASASGGGSSAGSGTQRSSRAVSSGGGTVRTSGSASRSSASSSSSSSAAAPAPRVTQAAPQPAVSSGSN